MAETSCLYIIAVPIGNIEDITLRALSILRSVDGVICEEIREGSTLLKRLGVQVKELIPVNEHNETDQVLSIINRLRQKQSFALISDCGTPVFSDPGSFLIQQVVQSGILVIPVPGPSSLMAALSILDFKLDQFVFGGFLPRQPDQRRSELNRLKSMRMAVVLMDTPYRLSALLEDVEKVFGPDQYITLACDLTLPSEKVFRGNIHAVHKQTGGKKAEFILILHPK
jgi:16S rRNA (cytidine1402-2'-O)-methyltransferase